MVVKASTWRTMSWMAFRKERMSLFQHTTVVQQSITFLCQTKIRTIVDQKWQLGFPVNSTNMESKPSAKNGTTASGGSSCGSQHFLTTGGVAVAGCTGDERRMGSERIIIRATSPCLQVKVINRSLWAQLPRSREGDRFHKAFFSHWEEKRSDRAQ